jgi:MSHA biogenesis protein MshP
MMHTPLHRARSAGVGLVTAIFLLVVLSGLGVAMVSLYTTQQAGADLDLAGARAYQAARAGIEFGLFQRRQVAGAAGCPGDQAPTILGAAQFQRASTLQGFTVVVTCIPGKGTGNPSANITSVACNMVDGQGRCEIPPNNPQYVRRRMEVQT